MGYQNFIEKRPDIKLEGLQEFDADENFFGHADSHYSPHDPFLGIYIDEALVNAQFPLVPRLSSFTTGGLENWHSKPFSGQRNRPCYFHTRFFGDGLQFSTYLFEFLIVGAC